MSGFQRKYNDARREGLPVQDGYMEGVDAVIAFLADWDDTGQLIRDIREGIEEGDL